MKPILKCFSCGEPFYTEKEAWIGEREDHIPFPNEAYDSKKEAQ